MDTNSTIEIVQGDITDQNVDAIVNAANTDLKLGSGVAGAIRKKGGPEVQIECDEHGPVSLGEAVITGAGNLEAKFVIHAAAMRLGGTVSSESLKSSTENALKIASDNNVKALAFPAIGTGVGNFPIHECADIMISSVLDYLSNVESSIEKVYFVLFDAYGYTVFKEALESKAQI